MREAQSNITSYPGEGEPKRSDTAAGNKAVSIIPTAISSFSLVKPQAVGTAQGAGGKDVLASLFLRQFNYTTYTTEAGAWYSLPAQPKLNFIWKNVMFKRTATGHFPSF